MLRAILFLLLTLGAFPPAAFAQTSADYSQGNMLAGGVTTPPPAVVSLTADNQIVTVGSNSYIRLTPNNATAANRTFCLTAGTAGQWLILENTTPGSELQDAANPCGGAGTSPNLASTYSFGGDDTMSLIYDGTKWVEMLRENN